MRRFFPSLAMAGACSVVLVAGCTEESGGASPSATTTTSGTSGSGVPACAGTVPDGICTLRAEAGDTCDCVDCAQAAGCTGKCVDDGTCDIAGDEDCTCQDCYSKPDECGGTTTTTTSTSESTTTTGGSGGTTTTSPGGAGGTGGAAGAGGVAVDAGAN